MSDDKDRGLTPDEARVLIRETVRETLLTLGLSTDDPIQVQRDFQHLREWRETTEAVKSKALLATIGLLTSGAVAAIWIGIKKYLGVPG